MHFKALKNRIVSLFVCLVLSPGAFAAPKEVVEAERYLNTLSSAKAQFLMTGSGGYEQKGTFYLNRPGKLRFEFDDLDDFIVADGRFIYFYDSELGEQSNAPIGTTLADFLLRDDIKLIDEDIGVHRIMRGGGLVQITLKQKDDPDAGELILGFTEEPFELKKWRVIDSLGSITEVELMDIDSAVSLPRRLFVYRDPSHGQGRLNE